MSIYNISKEKKSIYKNIFRFKEKSRQIKEYQKNKKQIDIITKLLIEHADVPQEIIDSLIECVEQNSILAYKLSKY